MNAKANSLFLAEPFRSEWQGKDPFVEVQKISAAAQPQNLLREKEGRRTLRFIFKTPGATSQSYFLKHHKGIGWKEIVKNLLQLRLPVLGASNEYRAAIKLQSLSVDTLTPVVYGQRGANPAAQESFLITNDLVNTVSLEDYCRHWPTTPPSFRVKRALINKVAEAARIMHTNGINHRDFYICHFLLDEKSLLNKLQKPHQKEGSPFYCYLIDLHRCQIRQHVPKRWLVKDLGGLFYSSMDIGLSARDYFRFIKKYTGKSLREALQNPLWCEALVNAEKLYQKDFAKTPPVIFKHKQ